MAIEEDLAASPSIAVFNLKTNTDIVCLRAVDFTPAIRYEVSLRISFREVAYENLPLQQPSGGRRRR